MLFKDLDAGFNFYIVNNPHGRTLFKKIYPIKSHFGDVIVAIDEDGSWYDSEFITDITEIEFTKDQQL